MSSAVIYTSITNGYDCLKTPKVKQSLPGICLADIEQKHNYWRYEQIYVRKNDPIRTARYHKILTHKILHPYEWSIWVDGSLSIENDLALLLDEVKRSDKKIAMYKHSKRNCIYQAAFNCIDKCKDNKHIICQQMDKYLSEGYPACNGLVASGVIVKKHHDLEVQQLMNLWWSEVKRYSRRDQLSFNYVCHKQNMKYMEIPGKIGDGKYFRRNPHQN